jgi:hypothetical protein
MVLVMENMGIFSKNSSVYPLGIELWELTWAIVDPVYPQLRNETFPPPPPPARKSGEGDVLLKNEDDVKTESPPTRVSYGSVPES